MYEAEKKLSKDLGFFEANRLVKKAVLAQRGNYIEDETYHQEETKTGMPAISLIAQKANKEGIYPVKWYEIELEKQLEDDLD